MISHKLTWLTALAVIAGCDSTGDDPEPTDAPMLEQQDGEYAYVLGVDPETDEPIRGGSHEVVSFDDEGKREAIDTLNRVNRFHPDMTSSSAFHSYDETLTEGESDVFVFASTWWPQSKNGTAWRWQPGAGQDYNNLSDVNRLAPTEKYDVLFYPGQPKQVAAVEHCEYRDFVDNGAEECTKISHPAITVAGPATQWELQNQGTYQTYDPENWWGHCNGWASYATTEPLGFPERDVKVKFVNNEVVECTSTETGCVLFKMADIEGLMTELYFSDQATFTGRRCNTAPDKIERDAFGRPTDPACRDLNPGSFHVAITGAFGRGARDLVQGREGVENPPFVIDYNYDFEIWNYPVVDYQILAQSTLTEQQAQEIVGAAGSDYQFNTSAAQFRQVHMQFHMISDAVPANQLLLRADQRPMDPVAVDLHYVLELDANGRILGGEWIEPPTAFVNSKELHPDFVWMAVHHKGPTEGADDLGGDDDNPHISYPRVREILLCANEPDSCAPAGGTGTQVLLDVTAAATGGQSLNYNTETLPPGTYMVTLAHDPAIPGGDADLYVRVGSAPTTTTWDCRPYADGSDEECEVTLTAPSVIHAMVRGYSPGANAFRLTIEGEGGGEEPPPGPDAWEGMNQTGTVAKNQEMHWSTGALAAGTYLFQLTGTNDADLYVRTGSAPTSTQYECRPYLNGSNETCTVNLTTGAEIFVMVRGYATSSTFTLVGSQQ